MNLRPWQRQQLLRTAIGLTSRSGNPAAVAANAEVLLAWAQQAAGRTDLAARLEALRQQESARVRARYAGRREPPRPDPCMDNPAEFVRQAQVLYAFAVADTAADIWGRS